MKISEVPDASELLDTSRPHWRKLLPSDQTDSPPRASQAIQNWFNTVRNAVQTLWYSGATPAARPVNPVLSQQFFDQSVTCFSPQGSPMVCIAERQGSTPAQWAALGPCPAAVSNPGVGNLASSWITALDVNFALLSSQSLGTDSTYSLGSIIPGTALTWTKVNSAADASAMQIINGSGLNITPIAASAYSKAGRTGPYLYLNLLPLLPTYDEGLRMRVWCYVSSDNSAANADTTQCNLDNLASLVAVNNPWLMQRATRGFQSGTHAIANETALPVQVLGVTSFLSAFGAANAVFMYDIWQFPAINTFTTYTGAIQAGDAWPTPVQMNLCAGNGQSNFSFDPQLNTSDYTKLFLVLTAVRNGSATAYSPVIRKVRVDYRA